MARRPLPSPGREGGRERRGGGRESGKGMLAMHTRGKTEAHFAHSGFVFGSDRAFQEAGLVAGVLGVVLVALFSYSTLRFLIRCVSGKKKREEEGGFRLHPLLLSQRFSYSPP